MLSSQITPILCKILRTLRHDELFAYMKKFTFQIYIILKLNDWHFRTRSFAPNILKTGDSKNANHSAKVNYLPV